jgi:acetyl-CoA C-acetyltransferase
MKALTLASLSIRSGQASCVLAGGAESMSNYPYTLQVRNGIGNKAKDSLGSDVLPDAVTKELPVKISDYVSAKLRITKEELDNYATLSCQRAARAEKEGKFKKEIVEIQHKKLLVNNSQDSLRPAEAVKKFKPIHQGGTTSVGNTCGLNDGAAFVVLASRKAARENQWKVLAVVKDFADAEQESNLFILSPSLAIEKMMSRNCFSLQQVQLFEFNEPFASAVIGNALLLGLSVERINVNGGALAFGHPVGSSGCRIVVSLISQLLERREEMGIAAICNGAGGASTVLIKAEI